MRQTAEDLSILGNDIHNNELGKFLDIARHDMPWAICEYTNRCEFTKGKIPELAYLERARFFGDGGDLELRRDVSRYKWRFVGPVEVKGFGNFSGRDFWQESGIPFLKEHEEKLVLWGRKTANGLYYHSKVASANLRYPLSTPSSRALILATSYTYYGRLQFAWYRRLEGWE